MRLVIDIPDWYYSELQEFKHPDFVDKAIRDGVILPKGHGRLIDADSIKSYFSDKEGDDFTAFHFYDAVDDAPTIIEADKED